MKRLVGRTDVADALDRLNKLTQEETRAAVVENLEIAHNIKDGVHRFLDHSYVPRTHNLFLYCSTAAEALKRLLHHNSLTIPYFS